MGEQISSLHPLSGVSPYSADMLLLGVVLAGFFNDRVVVALAVVGLRIWGCRWTPLPVSGIAQPLRTQSTLESASALRLAPMNCTGVLC